MMGVICSQLNCWPKVSHVNLTKSRLLLRQNVAICKLILARTRPTQFTAHGTGACMEPFLLCSSFFGVGRYSEDQRKRNMDNNPDTELLTFNLNCLHNILGQWWPRTCEGS